EKPTIAAVNGVAFAGGFLLAQMCDLCLAAEHAPVAITEAKAVLGASSARPRCPSPRQKGGGGGPWAMPLRWLVPPRVALELLLTGEPIDAARAYEVGLVNRVVPADELHSAAQALAGT